MALDWDGHTLKAGRPVGLGGSSQGLRGGGPPRTLTLAQLLGLLGSLFFLGQALTAMLVYVWSRRSPQVRVNFFGLLTFQAPFLPWALMGFSMLLGNSILVDLLGEPACPPSPSKLAVLPDPPPLPSPPRTSHLSHLQHLYSYSPLNKPAGLQVSHLQASSADACVSPDWGGMGRSAFQPWLPLRCSQVLGPGTLSFRANPSPILGWQSVQDTGHSCSEA